MYYEYVIFDSEFDPSLSGARLKFGVWMLRALLGRRSQAQEPRGTVELCLQLGSWGFMCFSLVDFIHFIGIFS